MGILSGNGIINIRSVELLKLVFHGKQVQATLNDSELVFLSVLTKHSVSSTASHTFSATMFRNGVGPYQANVILSNVGYNYFAGSIEYSMESGGMSE